MDGGLAGGWSSAVGWAASGDGRGGMAEHRIERHHQMRRSRAPLSASSKRSAIEGLP